MTESEQHALHSIAKALHSLQELLESISKRYKDEERESHRKVKVDIPPVDVRLPNEVAAYFNTEERSQTERDRREKFKFRIEIATFFLTLALVLVTGGTLVVFYKQLGESQSQTAIFKGQAEQAARDAQSEVGVARDALAASRKALRIEERPYVWTSNPPPEPIRHDVYDPPAAPGLSQLIVTVRFTNYGKSPAVDLRQATDIEYGQDALKRIKTSPFGKNKMLIPTGKLDFTSLVSEPTKKENISKALEMDLGVGIFIRWQYFDTDQHRYESDLCMLRLRNGNWTFCPTHNEIKDCESEECDK